jgi:hypothetical protein
MSPQGATAIAFLGRSVIVYKEIQSAQPIDRPAMLFAAASRGA